MIKSISVCVARSNCMKIAPIMRTFGERGEFQTLLVHTDQHHDAKRSHLFYAELNIPRPDVNFHSALANRIAGGNRWN